MLHDEREGVEQAALGDQRGAPPSLRLLAAGQDGLEDGVLRAEVVAQESVADPDGLGDLPHRQVVKAPSGKDGHGLRNIMSCDSKRADNNQQYRKY